MLNPESSTYHTYQAAFVVDLSKRDPANLLRADCSRKQFCSDLETRSDAEIRFLSNFEQGQAFLNAFKKYRSEELDLREKDQQSDKLFEPAFFQQEEEYDIIVATIINSSTGFITTIRYPNSYEIYDAASALDWVNSEASVFLLPQKCTSEFIDSFYALSRTDFNRNVKDQTDLFPLYLRRLIRGVSSNGIYSILRLYQELMEGRPGL